MANKKIKDFKTMKVEDLKVELIANRKSHPKRSKKKYSKN
jgi:hypothetical protein